MGPLHAFPFCQARDGGGHRVTSTPQARGFGGQKGRKNKGAGKGSHKSKTGKGKRKAQKDPYGGDAVRKCYKCGEPGHLASGCPV